MRRALLAAMFLAFVGALAAQACSGVALAGPTGVVVGGNEDNNKTNPAVWATAASSGRYGAVYFGFYFVGLGGRAPGWYEMQGVNDQGLFYDLFSMPCGPGDELAAASGDIRHTREAVECTMMATCATVEEALAFLHRRSYAELLPCVQVLVADRAGNAAVYTGDGDVFRNGPGLVVTNFNLVHPEFGEYPCVRYASASRLVTWDPTPTLDRVGQVLRAARYIPTPGEQGGPRYAVACDLVNGIADVYLDGDFSSRARLDLARLWVAGLERMPLVDLSFEPSLLP
jgi:hypothetical protein